MDRVERVARHVVGNAAPAAAHQARPPITSHVLDTGTGRPAAGVKVVLDKLEGSAWRNIGTDSTNSDGRCHKLTSSIEAGTYRCTFDTASYYSAKGERCFYPEVPIIFQIVNPSEHYHIPLLLSAFGYSTYRGS